MTDTPKGEDAPEELLEIDATAEKELEDIAVARAIATGMDPALAEELYRSKEKK